MDTIKEKRIRIMTTELLEKLKFARQKANEKRSELAKIKQMEKQIKNVEHQSKVKEITETYTKIVNPPAVVKTKKPIIVVEEENSESDEEEDIIYIKKPKPKTKVPAPAPVRPLKSDIAYHNLFNNPTRR